MSLRIAILGSGSGGNCTLIELEGDGGPMRILIDAGFSPRETTRRLTGFGLSLNDIDAVLITHLDGDHLREGWPKACVRHGIPMHLHRRHFRRADIHREMRDFAVAFDGEFRIGSATSVEPLLFAHDDLGTVGFLIEHGEARLGLATDLGRVPPALLERFVDLDLLAIESNYDRKMQIESNRPPPLKRRIMGGNGHLSNDQSLDAVVSIASRSRLRQVVLLHLSRQCNDPAIIRRLYRQRAPELVGRLTIASQFEPTRLIGIVGPPAVVAAPRPSPTLFTLAD